VPETGYARIIIKRWWPALIMMALIFIFSAMPSDDIPSFGIFDFSIKKLSHMIGYLILTRTYLHGIGKTRRGAEFVAWLLAVLYAMTDEFHQSFVPGRSSGWLDVGIDSFGAMLGLLPEVWGKYQRKKRFSD